MQSGPKRGKPTAPRRNRIIESSSSEEDDSSSSSSDSEPDPDDRTAAPEREGESSYRIPKLKSKKIWTPDQLKNLRKNFRNLENFDDSILASLTFKEMVAMGGKKDKNNKILTEKLAENYEKLRSFSTKIEAGEDQCTGQAHESRFLRGYVGNSQDLWVQARKKLGLTGLDPISNYETVSIGLNGHISSRVWHEVHSPSSKLLTLRMLTNSSMKTAWTAQEKSNDIKEFETMQELKMATVALDVCIRKVMPWNSSFATVAIFLHSVNFGEHDLAGKPNQLGFLADFVDEILRYNAQAWDEERYFMSAQEVAAKWSALFLRKFATTQRAGTDSSQKQEKNTNRNEKKPDAHEKFPPGVCKNFQFGKCTHPGDKHSASWDVDYVLRHICARYLPDKKRFCLSNHAKKDHK